MSFIASDKGGDFETIPEDTYTARCYRMIALGTQQPNNPTYKPNFQIMISWELIGIEDPHMKEGENKGKPFSYHQRYSLSLGDKSNLRQHLRAWRGKEFTKEEIKAFDVSTVLGAYCMLQIVHDETGKYANIGGILPYKGVKPLPVNKDVLFDIERPDMDVFNSLSDNLKGTIMQAPEWVGSKVEPSRPVEKPDPVIEDVEEEINLDDIPF